MKYRKKPVVIDAWEWTGKSPFELPVPEWCKPGHGIVFRKPDDGDPYVTINTLEGKMMVRPGDWIIRGVKGELYPCKPEIFAETYEPVTD